ncbi:MAG TPA: UDP-N-acetylmuramoyl-L-alanyl-D-glutamate--2,6-diaminopimelate ligase [Caulobacteraceae bacterium]|nr:UDP-N-acetylmuramoyl-L-alanyl-D-glutamate--2,6-diaminopimelate ligase [Caulobacteraceae bacterium]
MSAPRRLSEIVERALDADPVIAGVTADSRKVAPGVLFAALPGAKVDGRSFIPAAIAAGAAAILGPEDTPDQAVPTVRAGDVRRAYALAAARFYGAQPPVVVAVTGTNGKTSAATFCRQIFTRLGRQAASLGTLGLQTADQSLSTPPGLTTPDAAEIARLAAELCAHGVTHLALEASSHGLDQRRLDGLTLTAAGFTNLTQDHLDYHPDMNAYRAAKLRLFEALLPRGAAAVLNADAADFPAFAAAAVVHGQTVLSVGEAGQGLRLVSRTPTPEGQRLVVHAEGLDVEVRLPLAGAFQASNALVAAGLCIAAGEDAAAALGALEHLIGAPGRLQRVGAGVRGGEAYVDYAHTPDGLRTVLSALRPHVRGRLIVVFGAGGDRDRAKRPLMGGAAAELADLVIVTDDNPRSEDPAAIRRAILAAAPAALEVGDRRAAIRAAAEQLRDGDILVVAGKGHERGQIVGDQAHPFDDVEETALALGGVHA